MTLAQAVAIAIANSTANAKVTANVKATATTKAKILNTLEKVCLLGISLFDLMISQHNWENVRHNVKLLLILTKTLNKLYAKGLAHN